MKNGLLTLLACAATLLFAPGARAAGGHFDVDDATLLVPGRCQYEAWWVRAPAVNLNVWHLGPGCRVGPIELALNIDRASTSTDRRDALGPQIKWATDPLLGNVSVGLVASAALSATRGGKPSLTLYAPLTWNISEAMALNVNFGLDRNADAGRARRQGVSGEWALNEHVTLLAERAEFGGEWVSRLGARFALSETLSIDASAARTGPQALRAFAIGLNQEFGR
jgi:hypothetical protein